MTTLPDKPAGSVIKESVNPAGVTLSWPIPSVGPFRFAIAAFLAFWLCGWAVGWVSAVWAIINGGFHPFLVFWLGAWTLGGGFVMWALWSTLRPPRPESVWLESDLLRYDPGRTPYNPWQWHGWWGWSYPAIPKPTPAFTVARQDIRKFVLERVGERQRLSFDRGADRLEIGASLREPEREWLFAVLQSWLASDYSS